MKGLLLTVVFMLILSCVACSCGNTEEDITVPKPTPNSNSEAVRVEVGAEGENATPTPYEYSGEDTVNELGLYNNPDTDATPEPKLEYEQYRTLNPDVVGKISIPNTEIDYPVLYTDSNYYINHSPQRERSDYGSIYIDPRCSLADSYLIIYGHNMKNGSMFGGLHNFSDRNFFYSTPNFTLCIGDEIRTYRVFSTYVIDLDTDYPQFYNLGYVGDEWVKFLEEQRSLSKFDEPVTFVEDSEVVALCTCNRTSYKNGRELVLAIRVG